MPKIQSAIIGLFPHSQKPEVRTQTRMVFNIFHRERRIRQGAYNEKTIFIIS